MLDRAEYRDATPVGIAMLAALACGAAVTWFGSGSSWAPALLWAGACSSVGWVLGFLFGHFPTKVRKVSQDLYVARISPLRLPIRN